MVNEALLEFRLCGGLRWLVSGPCGYISSMGILTFISTDTDCSPYLLSLGLSKSMMSLVWIGMPSYTAPTAFVLGEQC